MITQHDCRVLRLCADRTTLRQCEIPHSVSFSVLSLIEVGDAGARLTRPPATADERPGEVRVA